MKAITICQPYAHLIAVGAKRVENRTWPTNYRGVIAIHAKDLGLKPGEQRKVASMQFNVGDGMVPLVEFVETPRERLKQQLREAKALRFTEDYLADVPPPSISEKYGTMTTGWWFNAYSRQVGQGCSSCSYHSRSSTAKTDTQRSVPLYSSKLLALRGLRRAKELEFAKVLAEIDGLIESTKKGG